jgi:hypothetical protein
MSSVIIPTGFRGVIEMQAEGIIVQPTSVSDQFNASIGGSNIGGMGNTNLIQHHHHYAGPSSLQPSTAGMCLRCFFGANSTFFISNHTITSTAVPAASATSPTQGNRQSRNESAPHAYARILMTRAIGYPLWIPEPPSRPPEYEVEGIRIGDVGVVDSDGQFDSFFNIFLPADHAINRLAPPSLVPLEFDPNNDVKQLIGIYPPETTIESGTIHKSLLRSQIEYDQCQSNVSLLITPNARSSGELVQYQFTCSSNEGAVLVLPNGASRINLRFLHNILEYAQQNVVSWYEHVYGTLGLEVEAGPLYLTTGHDKYDNWCLASYTDIPTEPGLSLAFNPRLGRARIVLYSSEASGAIDTRTFAPRGDISANQCIFIRGYKMSLCQSLIERILLGRVKISNIVPPNTGNVTERDVGLTVRLTGRLLPWFAGGNHGGNQPQLAEPHRDADTIDTHDNVNVNVENFPEILEVK